MGFLDRIVKQAISDTVGKAVGDKAAEFFGGLGGQNPQEGYGDGYPVQQQPQQPQGNPWQPVDATGQQANYGGYAPQRFAPKVLKSRDWFAATLQENFGDCIIRQNVPVAEMGGEGKPYDFLLIKDGAARAAIMLSEHNRTNNRAFKGANAACEAAGVPFINFFLHMQNEQDYVVNRIRSFLV